MDANFRLKLREHISRMIPSLDLGGRTRRRESYQEEMAKYGDQTEVCMIISVDRIREWLFPD